MSGLGIDAQLAAAHGAIEARGWTLAGSVIDGAVSGAVAPDRRGALGPALAVLDAGDADALVVARLDRLTRSLLAWAELVQRSQCEDWVIVAVAEGFDLSSPSGRAFAGMLAVMSEYERELIASRIREAMAAAKARGVRLGRPVEHSPAVRALVVSMRESGATLQAIADRLTGDGAAVGISPRCAASSTATDSTSRPPTLWIGSSLRLCWRWSPSRCCSYRSADARSLRRTTT